MLPGAPTACSVNWARTRSVAAINSDMGQSRYQ
jgi:hypothetical protein